MSFFLPTIFLLFCPSPCSVLPPAPKIDWGMSGESSLLEGKPGFAMDFNFFVEDNTVVIDEADVREQQGYVFCDTKCFSSET